jgi:hypothetical protein
MKSLLTQTAAAIKAAFAVSASVTASAAATQSIVASSTRIQERADEFSRLLHGQRQDCQSKRSRGRRAVRPVQ